MSQGRQALYLQRLVAYLKDQVTELDAAQRPLERAKVLGHVYRKAYRNGFNAAYMKFAVHQRQSLGTPCQVTT